MGKRTEIAGVKRIVRAEFKGKSYKEIEKAKLIMTSICGSDDIYIQAMDAVIRERRLRRESNLRSMDNCVIQAARATLGSSYGGRVSTGYLYDDEEN